MTCYSAEKSHKKARYFIQILEVVTLKEKVEAVNNNNETLKKHLKITPNSNAFISFRDFHHFDNERADTKMIDGLVDRIEVETTKHEVKQKSSQTHSKLGILNLFKMKAMRRHFLE